MPHDGVYLRPETPCQECQQPFGAHDVAMEPVPADRTVASFEGLTLSFVYCPAPEPEST